ncbi:MAG: site-specific integrase [Deltaproteobacteria bacterium]|jgi:integrase|nr:site-specific integrase [Deltaproteobacteria bacterium]
MAARIKTAYQGVFYREEVRMDSQTQTEKVFYIRYRTGGSDAKLVEEKAGRESEGMTAARASRERALRARGAEMSNRQKRDAIEAAGRAEEERPTIARLWQLYDEAHAGRKVRKTDAGFYRNHLESLFGGKVPAELVTLDLDRLRIKKLKILAPQTVKHILALLRCVINFGVKQGCCPQPDPSRLHFTFPKVDNQRTENLTREQMSAYLKALDEEPDQNAAALIRLVLATGIRKGAAMALQWSDIDFERGFITLQGQSAKNGKTARIPLSRAARTILEKVEHAGSPYIFPGRNGGQRADFKRQSQRVRDKAGLPKDFRPLHGLRHTFASWMASTGAVDLYTLQKLLTHGSTQMTQRYAHLADEALHRAAAVAGEVFQGVTGEKAAVIPFAKAKQA